MTFKDAQKLTGLLDENFDNEQDVNDMVVMLNSRFPKFIWKVPNKYEGSYIPIIVREVQKRPVREGKKK